MSWNDLLWRIGEPMQASAARALSTQKARTECLPAPTNPSTPTIRRSLTRPWFAWANSLAGELIELVALEGLL